MYIDIDLIDIELLPTVSSPFQGFSLLPCLPSSRITLCGRSTTPSVAPFSLHYPFSFHSVWLSFFTLDPWCQGKERKVSGFAPESLYYHALSFPSSLTAVKALFVSSAEDFCSTKKRRLGSFRERVLIQGMGGLGHGGFGGKDDAREGRREHGAEKKWQGWSHLLIGRFTYFYQYVATLLQMEFANKQEQG
eukprot:g61587.t1